MISIHLGSWACLLVGLCFITVLFSLQILKKICDHPLLLTMKAAEGVLEEMD